MSTQYNLNTKDSGSDSENKTWSFEKAINEFFRPLPPELKANRGACSGEAFIWHCTPNGVTCDVTPLLVLPQSKLI